MQNDRGVPTVIVRFNVSPDCVQWHQGVRPLRLDDRIVTMRPRVDAVLDRLRSSYPSVTFRADPFEWSPPHHVIQFLFPLGPFTSRQEEEIQAVAEPVLTSPGFRRIAVVEENLSRMSDDDLAKMLLLSNLVLPDTPTVVRVLDEVLFAVHSVEPLSCADVLVWVHPSFDDFDGCLHQAEASSPSLRYFWLQFLFKVPICVGIVAHEVAHALCCVRGIPADHGPQYVESLREVVGVILGTGCIDRVRSIIAEGTGGLASIPRLEGYPDIVDGGRWRMFSDGVGGYATWRFDGAGNWGVGSPDADLALPQLTENQKDFVLLSLGRHPSQSED